MNPNFDKLRGRIREKFKTEGAFARALGLGISTMSLKLQGKSDFTLSEIKKSIILLDICPAEINDYFFE